ncbi:hypothetical protein ACLBOM_02835 [Escherichia coli]
MGLLLCGNVEHDKGSFYSSFFQLSIGIERFFKIIFILNHMIEIILKSQYFRTLKKFSHNIAELHKNCSSYASHLPNLEWELNWQQNLILEMLSEFADASRYYNLDKI